jgi:hypothetical protein
MRSGRAALASILLALGCGGARGADPSRATVPPAPPPQCPWDTAPAAPEAGANGYRYRVSAGPGADQLCAEIDLPRGATAPRTWTLDPALRPFVRDVFLAGGAGIASAVPDGWLVPGCAAGQVCRLRYRVLLGDAARRLEDFDEAAAQAGAILSPPSAWLLRPVDVSAPFTLAVGTAPGESFVTGLALIAPGATAFRGDVGELDDTPYAVFGQLVTGRRRVSGGELDVAFAGGKPSPAIDAWVDGALGALAAYYGRFPIDHAALLVRLRPGDGINAGRTMGHGGGAVIMPVGEATGAAALADDWVLVHELVHVSFPDVSTPWAEEGLATYLEPVIRVRSGLCDVDYVWRSLVEGLPQGQPGPGDGGLDVTDTWGRRYWGGAMFWMLADVEIRKRTGGARSLDDALRAVNRAGGNVAVRWDLDKTLALADAGTGATVLGPLRKQMGSSPVKVDLDALWKSLGVAQVGKKMVYDDSAPLAAVRQAITRKPAVR